MHRGVYFIIEETIVMKRRKSILVTGLLAVLALVAGSTLAQDRPVHPGTGKEELLYKGAPVPIKPEEAPERITPKAPALTAAEFTRAKHIYFERCASCHR